MEGTARPAMGMLCLLFLITLFPGQGECSRRRHPRRHRGGCSVPDPSSNGFIDHPPRTHVGPDLFVIILFRDGGCSVPDPPSNGFIDHPPRTHVSPGTMITYTCAEDHYMDLNQSPDYTERYEYNYNPDVSFIVRQYVRKCERNGAFSGLRITECKERKEYTECGISDVKDCYAKNVHITNGNVTTNILFPWTVNIYQNDAWSAADKQKYIGGINSINGQPYGQGTLIGNRWVLTAAHLWYKGNDKLNKLNDTSFLLEFSSDDGQGTIVRGVKKTFFRGYKFIEDIRVGDNDTMLIQLEGSLSFNKFRNPVCLPKPLAVFNQQFEPDLLGKYDDGKLGYVVGHDPTHGKMSSVCLPIRPCSYRGLHHGMFEEGPVPSLFCAGVVVWKGRGSEVRDTDRGDSGSAFVSLCPDRRKEKKTDKRYVALGITSFNAMPETQHRRGYAGLGGYANVSFHMKWIEETITEAETNDGSK